jgi:hypothetical protein
MRMNRVFTSVARHSLAIIALGVLLLVSSSKDSTPTFNPSPNRQLASVALANSRMPPVKFGIWLAYQPKWLETYGPKGVGWTGLSPAVDYDLDWTTSAACGYSPRYTAVSRSWLVDGKINWDEVDQRIARAVLFGADWVYVDDALSGAYWDEAGPIPVSVMAEFCRRVHRAGKLAAIADMDQAMLNYSAFVGFYDSVDVFMPYGYTRSLDTLINFFEWVRTSFPEKKIVPYLGYHVWDRVKKRWTSQLGSASGDVPFIETAAMYSTENLIFYYTEPDDWKHAFEHNGGEGQRGQQFYLDELSAYLRQFKYLPETL